MKSVLPVVAGVAVGYYLQDSETAVRIAAGVGTAYVVDKMMGPPRMPTLPYDPVDPFQHLKPNPFLPLGPGNHILDPHLPFYGHMSGTTKLTPGNHMLDPLPYDPFNPLQPGNHMLDPNLPNYGHWSGTTKLKPGNHMLDPLPFVPTTPSTPLQSPLTNLHPGNHMLDPNLPNYGHWSGTDKLSPPSGWDAYTKVHEMLTGSTGGFNPPETAYNWLNANPGAWAATKGMSSAYYYYYLTTIDRFYPALKSSGEAQWNVLTDLWASASGNGAAGQNGVAQAMIDTYWINLLQGETGPAEKFRQKLWDHAGGSPSNACFLVNGPKVNPMADATEAKCHSAKGHCGNMQSMIGGTCQWTDYETAKG